MDCLALVLSPFPPGCRRPAVYNLAAAHLLCVPRRMTPRSTSVFRPFRPMEELCISLWQNLALLLPHFEIPACPDRRPLCTVSYCRSAALLGEHCLTPPSDHSATSLCPREHQTHQVGWSAVPQLSIVDPILAMLYRKTTGRQSRAPSNALFLEASLRSHVVARCVKDSVDAKAPVTALGLWAIFAVRPRILPHHHLLTPHTFRAQPIRAGFRPRCSRHGSGCASIDLHA